MFHIPMAALIKGAATLNEEFFTEVIPIAWELLLETDQVNVVDFNESVLMNLFECHHNRKQQPIRPLYS